MSSSDRCDAGDPSVSQASGRLCLLESRVQRQENDRRRLADEVRTLSAALELEQARRRRLEQQVSEQSRLIHENSSAILAVVDSRIWRTLVKLGGIVLRLRLSHRQPANKADPGAFLLESSGGSAAPSKVAVTPMPAGARGADGHAHEHRESQESLDCGTAGATPRPTTIREWKDVLRRAAEGLPRQSADSPLFTILTPVYNTEPEWLAEAAHSVLQQTITDWEWCVVDDGSHRTEFDSVLSVFEGNPRVLISRLSGHQGISAAINAGLQAARGRFVCVFDHDDILASDALSRCADVLQAGYDAVYTDEDKISKTGVQLQRFCKPDWSPEYFRNVMYVGHLLCVRRDLATEIGGFDSRYDRVQDFEFFVRYSERTSRIAHLNEILYHWRAVEGSIAHDQHSKGDLAPLQLAAVQAHLDRMNLPADARQGRRTHVLRIVPRGRASMPKVSIIIPTCDAPPALSACLASLSDKTTYADREVICVHSGPRDTHALELMRAFRATCVFSDDSFRPSEAHNLGAGHAAGEYLVFMGAGIEVLTPDWVEEMLYYAEQDDVGAVGGLILTPYQIVQQAGIAVTCRSVLEPMWSGQTSDSDGCFCSLATAHEVTAVSSTCLMVRKDLFQREGGFDTGFLTGGHDVDLCLRLSSVKKRNIFTPHARFLNNEADSADQLVSSADRDLLAKRWQSYIRAGDRYYRPADCAGSSAADFGDPAT